MSDNGYPPGWVACAMCGGYGLRTSSWGDVVDCDECLGSGMTRDRDACGRFRSQRRPVLSDTNVCGKSCGMIEVHVDEGVSYNPPLYIPAQCALVAGHQGICQP